MGIVEGFHQDLEVYYSIAPSLVRGYQGIMHIEIHTRCLSPANTLLQCGTPLVQDESLWRVLLKAMMAASIAEMEYSVLYQQVRTF